MRTCCRNEKKIYCSSSFISSASEVFDSLNDWIVNGEGVMTSSLTGILLILSFLELASPMNCGSHRNRQ